MWISDTATTALMVPIIEAVMKNMREQSLSSGSDDSNKSIEFIENYFRKMRESEGRVLFLLFEQ